MDPKFLQHTKPDLSKLPRMMWFDNSTIENFLDCNRLGWFTSFLEQKSPAMAAGTVWHAALEEFAKSGDAAKADLALARSFQEHKTILETAAARLSFPNIHKAFQLYSEKFAHDMLTHHAQEITFAVWIPGGHQDLTLQPCPEGNCWAGDNPDACFWFVGRFDGIVTYMNDLLVFENKTASNLGTGTLEGFRVSRQATSYIFAMRQILAKNGFTAQKLRGVLFNITCIQQAKTEFSRYVVLVHQKRLEEWLRETKLIVPQIRRAFAGDELPIKNRKQCTRYGTCSFIKLCDAWEGGVKSQPPNMITNFKPKTWRPY